MPTNFPTSKDDSSSLPNPTGTSKQNSPDHAGLHSSENAAIIAVQTKLGTGSSTPASSTLLVGTGAGTSAWQGLTSAQLAAVLSDETGSGAAVFANTPTLITPKVDTINENTPSNGVTVAGLNIKSGVLNTNNSVISSNIASFSYATSTISNPYKFHVRRNAAQSTSAAAFAKINFDTEDFDTNNNFDNATNFRYTAPLSGFYQFNGGAVTGGSAGAFFLCSLYKNGTECRRGAELNSSGSVGSTFSDLIQVTAGDYFEAFVFSTNAVAYDVSTSATQPYFSGYLMSRT